MSKKPIGASSIFVILGLLFIAIIGIRTISTPEIWSHLAQGRNNVPLSFLEAETSVNPSHLYDKLVFALWNLGQAPALILFNVLCLVASFGLLLKIAGKWGGALSQGFALLIAGHLIFQSIDVGPQTAMMLFIALFMYLLATVKTPAVLFGALIPLQILWTNMHSSFLFGPLIAALTLLQAVQNEKNPSRRGRQSLPTGLLAALSIALLASTLINPYFAKLHTQVIANIQSAAPVYWSSLFLDYFQIPPRKPLIFFVLILGAGGLITLKKRLPTVLTTLAIIGAFLAWSSPKTTMLFAILSFPFVVLSLSATSEYIRATLKTVMGKQGKLLEPATGLVLVLLMALSIIPVVGNHTYANTGSASNFGLGVEEQLYPEHAEAIIAHPAFPEKVINLPADGGYLAWKYPGRKVFVDYRPGTYDKDMLAQLDSMMLGSSKAYDEIYEAHRPEAFIINTLHSASAQGIVTLLRKGIWKLAYFDGTTAILLMDKPEFAPILNNAEAQQAGLARLEQARTDYAAKLGKSAHAGNPAELIGSGKIFLAFNRPAESKAIFSLLLQGNKSIPGAWVGLGNSLLLLKEFDAAAEALATATTLAPNSLFAWASYANACKYAGKSAEQERAQQKARQLAQQYKAAAEADAEPAEKIELPQDFSVLGQSIETLVIPE